jgi:3-dehydroquinate dehydratase-1
MPVPQIGPVELGRVPRVVLAVDRDSPSLQKAAEVGAHILEVRVDQFDRKDVLSAEKTVSRLRDHGLPLIATVRARGEGGQAFLTDSDRADLYVHLTDLVHAVDIEMRSPAVVERVRETARRAGNALILSYHDFKQTPTDNDLDQIVADAAALNADITKIATFANTPSDVEALLRLTLRHRSHNLVTIALGPLGSISRLTFPLFGSLMTYTSTTPTDGQIRLDMLVDHLRLYYPELNAEYVKQLGLLEYA